MLRSISCGLRPRPTDSDPWGSKSTSRTLRPYSARAAPRLIVVVVLPTPPFWLHIETTRAWVSPVTGFGSGRWGIGRPVGPRVDSWSWMGRSNGRGSLTAAVSVGEGTDGRAGGGISAALLPCEPEE